MCRAVIRSFVVSQMQLQDAYLGRHSEFRTHSLRCVGINCLVALEREAWRNEYVMMAVSTVAAFAVSSNTTFAV